MSETFRYYKVNCYDLDGIHHTDPSCPTGKQYRDRANAVKAVEMWARRACDATFLQGIFQHTFSGVTSVRVRDGSIHFHVEDRLVAISCEWEGRETKLNRTVETRVIDGETFCREKETEELVRDWYPLTREGHYNDRGHWVDTAPLLDKLIIYVDPYTIELED